MKQLHDGLLISQESDLNIQNGIWTLFITIQHPPNLDIDKSVQLIRVTVRKTEGQFSNRSSINWDIIHHGSVLLDTSQAPRSN